MTAGSRAPRALLTATALVALGLWAVTCNEYNPSLLHYSQPNTGPDDASFQADADASDAQAADAVSEPDVADSSDEPVTDATSDPPLDAFDDADAIDALDDVVDEPDAPEDAPAATCDQCPELALAHAPCPPNVPDSESLAEPLVFAVREARMGMSTAPQDEDEWRELGLDLDCLHTQSDGKPLQCRNSSATAVQDGFEGRDNSLANNVGGFIRTMAILGLIEGDPQQAMNDRFNRGAGGLLIRIADYNGEANDPRVVVSILFSTGVVDEDGGKATANWDGQDRWAVDEQSVAYSGEPKYTDDAAYVVDDVVVAHLPDGVPMEFVSDTATIELSINHSVLQLKMSPDHTRVIDGTIAGVWHTITALTALDRYAAQMGICPDFPGYAIARDKFATSSDTRLDLKPAPDLDCNAISMGVGIKAERALFGPIMPAPPDPPSQCTDAGVDAGQEAGAGAHDDSGIATPAVPEL